MVNVFKILWPKYMLYFLYFNNNTKYNTSSHALSLLGLWSANCKVTMLCHTKYKVYARYYTKRLIVCIQQK